MKKIILVPALLGVMGIGGVMAAVGGNLIGSADSSNLLSVSEIEKKAIQVVDGKIKDIELEKEGKKSYYEVDIVTDDFEYDLKFDAFTGELLKKKKDDRDDDDHDDLDDKPKQQVQSTTEQVSSQVNNNETTKQVTNNQATTKQVNTNETVKNSETAKQVTNNQATAAKPSTTTAPRKLSVNEIKAKALSVVNGKIVEVDFDNDDNRSYYEVEIITNNAEYELKFDAYTGALLKKEVDDLDDDYDDDDHDDDYDDDNDDD